LIFPDLEQFESKDFAEAEKYIAEKVSEINKKLPVYKQLAEIEVRRTEFEKTASRKIKRHLLK
jgi:long-chain acyl-CoA synthetase